MTLKLNFACNLYDRTVALQNGSVTPQGIDLNYLVMNVGEIFRRQARYAEFDVAEMSLSTYGILHSQGDRRMIAIPVFLSRKFRHSEIFVNIESGINDPKDLIGKRMGSAEYQQTAGVWQRAHLQHDYGVAPEQMEWFFGPMTEPDPNFAERVPITLPGNLRIHPIASHQYLDKMLEDGDVDAVMYASEVPSFRRGSPNIARLFPDFRNVEADYFRRTGIFPVMHTVVIKRDIYDKAPWVAISLYEAFVKAKAAAMQRQQDMGALFSMLPWIGDHLREQREIMGDDPFAYGLKRNRGLLETFFQYSFEQGLVNRVLTLEKLLAPETMG